MSHITKKYLDASGSTEKIPSCEVRLYELPNKLIFFLRIRTDGTNISKMRRKNDIQVLLEGKTRGQRIFWMQITRLESFDA